MKKLPGYILLLFILSNSPLFAQDFHLSQFDMATQYLNPALTGMYELQNGDYRIYNDYRSQWAALGKPFTTIYLGYDMPFRKRGKNFGLGAYLIDNRAPVGSFNTFNFMVSGAYNIINKASQKHYLTTGLQIGLFYKFFNPNSYTYDNQYSPTEGGFDQSIPNNESFGKRGIVRFDANYGIYYKYIDEDKKVHPFLSFSIQHLTMPNESFTSVKSHLPMRFNLYAGTDLILSNQIKLCPRFLYMNEAAANEIDGGLLVFYRLGSTPTQLMLGGDYRSQDAIVLHAGIKVSEDIFRFSYDINTSYLNAFSGGRGAWELSLIITGIKGQPLFSKSMFESSSYNKF